MAAKTEKKFVIRNPEDPASDRQLWLLNQRGMLAIATKPGTTINKGVASAAIDKLPKRS